MTPASVAASTSPPNIIGSSNSGTGSVEGAWPNKQGSVRLAIEKVILRVVDKGVSSRSSFRLDHVYSLRNVTATNMILGKDKKNNDDTVSLNYSPSMAIGVVMEHNFEGVTCFTPTKRSTNVLEHIDLQQ